LCFICHQPGHLSSACPKRNGNYQPARGQYVPRPEKNMQGWDGLAKVHAIMAELDEEEQEANYMVINNEGF